MPVTTGLRDSACEVAVLAEELQTEMFLLVLIQVTVLLHLCCYYLTRVADRLLPEHCIPLLDPSHGYLHRVEHVPSPT